MNSQSDPTRHRRRLTLGATVILLFAQLQIAPTLAADGTRVGGKCRECGVVESSREVGTKKGGRNEPPSKSPKSYEVTVRMGDGSSRVFTDVNLASWRPGERMILIEHESPP